MRRALREGDEGQGQREGRSVRDHQFQRLVSAFMGVRHLHASDGPEREAWQAGREILHECERLRKKMRRSRSEREEDLCGQ